VASEGGTVAVSSPSVFVTTFLAAAVEVIEMVIIVVGVGSVRGWRSTWLGAGAGLGALAMLILALGTALQAVPIDALRLVIGSLLLVFGLQWLRKGVCRMSANGLAGMGERTASAAGVPADGVDWTGFVLAFKGVLLEGLEVAFIVVSVGLTARALGSAAVGAAVAFVVIAAAGLLARRVVQRIPRSARSGGTAAWAARSCRASETRRCWAPSCRSRSIRRRVWSAVATIRAREAVNSACASALAIAVATSSVKPASRDSVSGAAAPHRSKRRGSPPSGDCCPQRIPSRK
jgi:uncharacterized membrane protein